MEPTVWRGTTANDRAADRRTHLLEVALELVGERGAGGLTVRELYARAKLNPRYFYESFDDLDGLLGTLFDEQAAHLVAVVLDAVETAENTEAAKLRAALDTAFRHLTDDPRRIQILVTDAIGNPILAARRRVLVHASADQMADQAVRFHGVPQDTRRLRSTTFMLAGGLAEMMIAWHNGTLPLTVDELIDDATVLASGLSAAARGVGA